MAYHFSGSFNGCQWGINQSGLRCSVKAGNHDLIRNFQSFFLQGTDQMNGKIIVGTDKSVRQGWHLLQLTDQPVGIVVRGIIRRKDADSVILWKSGFLDRKSVV